MQYYVTDLCHGKRKEWGGILCYIISQGGSCKCARMLSVIYLCQGGGSKCGWTSKLQCYLPLPRWRLKRWTMTAQPCYLPLLMGLVAMGQVYTVDLALLRIPAVWQIPGWTPAGQICCAAQDWGSLNQVSRIKLSTNMTSHQQSNNTQP